MVYEYGQAHRTYTGGELLSKSESQCEVLVKWNRSAGPVHQLHMLTLTSLGCRISYINYIVGTNYW